MAGALALTLAKEADRNKEKASELDAKRKAAHAKIDEEYAAALSELPTKNEVRKGEIIESVVTTEWAGKQFIACIQMGKVQIQEAAKEPAKAPQVTPQKSK